MNLKYNLVSNDWLIGKKYRIKKKNIKKVALEADILYNRNV